MCGKKRAPSKNVNDEQIRIMKYFYVHLHKNSDTTKERD